MEDAGVVDGEDRRPGPVRLHRHHALGELLRRRVAAAQQRRHGAERRRPEQLRQADPAAERRLGAGEQARSEHRVAAKLEEFTVVPSAAAQQLRPDHCELRLLRRGRRRGDRGRCRRSLAGGLDALPRQANRLLCVEERQFGDAACDIGRCRLHDVEEALQQPQRGRPVEQVRVELQDARQPVGRSTRNMLRSCFAPGGWCGMPLSAKAPWSASRAKARCTRKFTASNGPRRSPGSASGRVSASSSLGAWACSSASPTVTRAASSTAAKLGSPDRSHRSSNALMKVPTTASSSTSSRPATWVPMTTSGAPVQRCSAVASAATPKVRRWRPATAPPHAPHPTGCAAAGR